MTVKRGSLIMKEIPSKAYIAYRLRSMATEMDAIAEMMGLHSQSSECAFHSKELLGAKTMACQWADELDRLWADEIDKDPVLQNQGQ
jgi:bacterioferritin-associated ferredoxin